MGESVKNKVFSGVIWSAIERFSVQGVNFVLNLIIARMLLPSDYGLIAMLSIFIALSQNLTEAGLGYALIQKIDRTQKDISTAFYYNIFVSGFIYLILYFSAPYIANFYETPKLTLITRVVSLSIIINSIGMVQYTLLTISMNFKKIAIASLTAVTISGSLGVYMAYNGFGVWTLVIQTLLTNIINISLLWVINRWIPRHGFSFESFKKLFSFSSKVLLSGIIHTLYMNMYNLVIGKKFESQELGYYNRAFTLAQFPSINITNIIVRVIYPDLCEKQNNPEVLKDSFLTYMRIACYIVFPIMIILSALADPLIRLILKDNWVNSIPLLQVLCIAFMWDPVMKTNHTVINASGRSDYFLYAEILKKIAGVIILVATIPYGVTVMCYGLILYSFVDMTIIIFFNRKLTGITYLKQLKNIIPFVVLSFVTGALVVYIITFLPDGENFIKLFVGGLSGLLIYILLSIIFRIKEMMIILNLIKTKLF